MCCYGFIGLFNYNVKLLKQTNQDKNNTPLSSSNAKGTASADEYEIETVIF